MKSTTPSSSDLSTPGIPGHSGIPGATRDDAQPSHSGTANDELISPPKMATEAPTSSPRPAPQPLGIAARVMRKFNTPTGRRAMMTLFDQIFRSATTFLAGVLVARYCTRTEHGWFVVGFTMVLYLSGFQETLVASPMYVLLPRRRGKAKQWYLASATQWQMRLSLATMGAMLIAAVGVMLLDSNWILFLIMIPLGAVALLRDFIRQTAFAVHKPHLALWVDVPLAISQIGTLGWLAWMGHLNAYTALLTVMLTSAAACIWPAIRLQMEGRLARSRHMKRTGQSHFKFGKWVFLGRMGYNIAFGSFPMILLLMYNEQVTGVFGACFRVAVLISPFLAGGVNFFLPKFSHDAVRLGDRGAMGVVAQFTIYFSLFMALLVGGIWLMGDKMLHWLYSGKYDDQGDLLGVLLLGVLFNAMSFCMQLGFMAIRKPHLNAAIMAWVVLLSLPISVLAIHQWGAFGAGVGYMCAAIISTLIRAFLFIRLRRQMAAGPGGPGSGPGEVSAISGVSGVSGASGASGV